MTVSKLQIPSCVICLGQLLIVTDTWYLNYFESMPDFMVLGFIQLVLFNLRPNYETVKVTFSEINFVDFL